MDTTIASARLVRTYRPGFLLGPLGWLNEKLSISLVHEPEFLALLFALEPYAMHLLGIAMAHDCNESLLTSLFRQAPRALVEQTIGHWPEGLDRLLRVLPATVLSLEEYRAIPQLLSDRPTTKFLKHQRIVDGPMIAGLSALPLVLRRPAVFKLFNQLERMDRFMHGLRFLSNRANLVFDRFLADLGALDQTDQVIAKIVGLVENLPLPALPPPFVGLFQRIDGVAEIRNLAKTWQNCLADYLHSINEGTATVYHFNSGGLPAVAFVLRFDRLGWLLNQVKGPKNVDIEPRYLSCHQNTFLDVGIPNCPDVAAIKDLVLQTRWLRRFGN
jgi:hypothetical protein